METIPTNPMYADNSGNPIANGIADKIRIPNRKLENILSCVKVRTKTIRLNKKNRIDEIPLKIIEKNIESVFDTKKQNDLRNICYISHINFVVLSFVPRRD